MLIVETTRRPPRAATRPLVWTQTTGGVWLPDYERTAGGVYAPVALLDAMRAGVQRFHAFSMWCPAPLGV